MRVVLTSTFSSNHGADLYESKYSHDKCPVPEEIHYLIKIKFILGRSSSPGFLINSNGSQPGLCNFFSTGKVVFLFLLNRLLVVMLKVLDIPLWRRGLSLLEALP